MPRAKKPPEGTRIREDWQASADLIQWVRAEYPWLESKLEKIVAEFVDHYISETGTKALKANWDATFRNWVRRHDRFYPSSQPVPSFNAVNSH